MLCKTRGIVLHAIPYNDRYHIVHLYTEAFGRVAYMVARSRSRHTAVAKSLFMPLAVLDLEVEHLPRRELQRIRESRPCYSSVHLSAHPVKNAIALFLAELLYRVLRDTEPDASLFDYLYRAIHLLEHTETGVANFHLVFLLGLLRHLGVTPRPATYRPGALFDMQDGAFVPSPPSHPHYLNVTESLILHHLLRLSFENMTLYAFSREQRTLIIRRILDYYRLHLPPFPAIKSLDIVQSLFIQA